MKKVVLSTILAFGLTSSLSAYELNGDFNLKWTGFKLASKVGVCLFNKRVVCKVVEVEKGVAQTLIDFPEHLSQ